MVDLPFGSATSRLDARFSVGVLLPCLVFCVLGSAAVLLAHGVRPSEAWWQSLGTAGQTLSVLAGLCAALMIAWILAGQITALLALGAGHWPGPVGRVASAWCRSRQLGRYRTLRARAATDPQAREGLYYGFPQREADVSPTELGNLLRAVEDYARTRYGLDLVLVWPRLYKVLPTEAASSIASAKAEIELQLVTTALSLTFGIGLSVALSVLHAPAALLCGWLWGCVAVAFLSYRSAVASTLAYGDEIRSALDLHRRGLLAAAQTGAGLGDHDERTQWELLMRLWYSGLPIEVERAPAGPTAAPAPGPARGSAHPIASRLGASVPPLVGALTLTALLNAILFAAA